MHLHLPHLLSADGADWNRDITDPEILARLPAPLADALKERNGCLAWQGIVHVRGACLEPTWHSLRNAIEGADSFANLYPDLLPSDVPFAEEAFGDQWVHRNGRIGRLSGETGELVWDVAESIEEWLARLLADPAEMLGYEPVQALEAVGGVLPPGHLISVYPPFVVDAGDASRTFKPVPTMDRRGYLAGIAAKIRDLPDGAEVEFKAET